ncbi:MAG: AsmA family protein [Bacteroidales bacterium]|jgi:hypothetical protein|nr:AsmA family protein [Bacteroidales bacterium]
MKRTLKIIGLSVSAIVALIVIIALIASWLVFTPTKLTPIVRSQLGKYLTCRSDIGTVDLSLFRSFPNAGLKINNMLLINPMEGAMSDTLLCVEECHVELNLLALLKNREVIVNEFHLRNGVANIYTDRAGHSNYMVFNTDTTTSVTEDDGEGFTIDRFDIKGLSVTNVRLSYDDLQAGMRAAAQLSALEIEAELDGDKLDGDCQLHTRELLFAMTDSVPMLVRLNKADAEFKGAIQSNDLVSGLLDATLRGVTFRYDNVAYVDSALVEAHLPLNLSVKQQSIDLQDASIALAKHLLKVAGHVGVDSGSINLDLTAIADRWDIAKALTLVPAPYRSALDGITAAGALSFTGSVAGVYNDSVMPVVKMSARCTGAEVTAKEYWPYPVTALDADISADIDLNAKSNLLINSLKAKTANNTLECSGAVGDLLNRQNCELSFKTGLTLSELQSVLPAELKVSGKVQGSGNAKFSVDQLVNMALDKLGVNGLFAVSDLDITYSDSMRVRAKTADVELKMPGASGQKLFRELLSAKIKSPSLGFDMTGLLTAGSNALDATIGLSNVLDTTKFMSLYCDFTATSFDVKMDSISAQAVAPTGNFTLLPAVKNPKNMAFRYSLKSDSLYANMGKDFTFSSSVIDVQEGRAEYDNTTDDLLLQWSPAFNAIMRRGYISLTGLPDPLRIPVANLIFTPDSMNLKKTVFRLGNSEFELSGVASNIQNYIANKGLLTAEFDFVSNNTDVYQLMDYFNGFGSDSLAVETETATAKTDTADSGPFMVPLGLDVRLHTTIKKATVGKTVIQDVGGHLTVNDGTLVLQEMGFTSNAARMLLSAVYQSPRPNHLFTSVDFHLLDVNIAELINIIPYVDTIVPMLKSFDGKGEFHFAVETNLNSKYELKMSTLRGAAAFDGQNLTLKRTSEFNKIAEKLMYGNKDKLVVDSIDVEMTIFRDEVDLYPFLLSMGNYKAVIGGRHNIDKNLTYDYHISLTDSPLPMRLGVDVFDKGKGFEVKLASCKYAALYRPKKQGAVEKQTLEFKKLILESLRSTVREDDAQLIIKPQRD